jgi:hypothetical protein
VQWSTRVAETVALAVAGVALVVVAALLDPAGRVLVGIAAVLLLLLALRDRVLRPRLATDPGGLLVRRLSGTMELPWAQLRVQVRETRRWGVRARLLELDTSAGPDDDGTLVLLGRRDLGADPEDVARALLAWSTTVGTVSATTTRAAPRSMSPSTCSSVRRRASTTTLVAANPATSPPRWPSRETPGRKLMTTLMASRVSNPRRSCLRAIITTARPPSSP